MLLKWFSLNSDIVIPFNLQKHMLRIWSLCGHLKSNERTHGDNGLLNVRSLAAIKHKIISFEIQQWIQTRCYLNILLISQAKLWCIEYFENNLRSMWIEKNKLTKEICVIFDMFFLAKKRSSLLFFMCPCLWLELTKATQWVELIHLIFFLLSS